MRVATNLGEPVCLRIMGDELDPLACYRQTCMSAGAEHRHPCWRCVRLCRLCPQLAAAWVANDKPPRARTLEDKLKRKLRETVPAARFSPLEIYAWGICGDPIGCDAARLSLLAPRRGRARHRMARLVWVTMSINRQSLETKIGAGIADARDFVSVARHVI